MRAATACPSRTSWGSPRSRPVGIPGCGGGPAGRTWTVVGSGRSRRSMMVGGVMKDGLGQALNGANRLGDGVKIRAIQNIRMRNRWSVTGPQAMSAGSRDSQHEGRDGMPQQDQLGQSWAATIETVKTGVERAAKEGSDTPRTREGRKGLANTDEDEPGGTDAEADAHRGRDTVETRPADFSGDGAVNTLYYRSIFCVHSSTLRL